MPLGLGCGQGKSCVSRQSSVLSNLSLPLRWPLQQQLHGAPRLCPRCSSQVGRDISAPSGPTGPTSNVTHVNCLSQEDPCYCMAAPNGRDLHCPSPGSAYRTLSVSIPSQWCHPSSGNRGLFNFADLYAWYGHKLHAWDSAHVSLSLSSQTKFSGRQKGGAKAGTELIQYSAEGPPPLPV